MRDERENNCESDERELETQKITIDKVIMNMDKREYGVREKREKNNKRGREIKIMREKITWR